MVPAVPPGSGIGAAMSTLDLPVGTRFLKDSRSVTQSRDAVLGDRRSNVVVGAYVSNGEQPTRARTVHRVSSVAELVPAHGHRIPSVDDCRACHENAFAVLGFYGAAFPPPPPPPLPTASRSIMRRTRTAPRPEC
jgi:hypothetical protein